MWRKENQRPNAGSVPLFNQSKRSRLPLTSNPSESKLFTASHYNETQSSSSSSSSSPGLPTLGQRGQWNQRVYPSSQQVNMRAAPSPVVAGRGYAPLPHPKNPAYAWPQIGQQRPLMRRDSTPVVGSQLRGSFPRSNSFSPGLTSGIQNEQSFNRPADPPRMLYRPRQCSPAAGSTQHPGAQSQSEMWTFRPVGQSTTGMWPKEKMDTTSVRTTPQQQKPQLETSLRLVTAVIEGMKHWSQYKNRVPMLFEIFAKLDSAVTVGEHGAKKFLMRDGKDVVQCLYYENNRTLPRLIRGQVHRCMGNYYSDKDTLTCISVRAASLSEQRNAQEAVTASDAEMRNVVQALREM